MGGKASSQCPFGKLVGNVLQAFFIPNVARIRIFASNIRDFSLLTQSDLLHEYDENQLQPHLQ
jgi:hypothetical protein